MPNFLLDEELEKFESIKRVGINKKICDGGEKIIN